MNEDKEFLKIKKSVEINNKIIQNIADISKFLENSKGWEIILKTGHELVCRIFTNHFENEKLKAKILDILKNVLDEDLKRLKENHEEFKTK